MLPLDLGGDLQFLGFEARGAVRPEELVRLLSDRFARFAVVLEYVFDLFVRHFGDKKAVVDATVKAHRGEDGRHALVQLVKEDVLGVERDPTDQKHRSITQRCRSAHEAFGAIEVRPPHVDST